MSAIMKNNLKKALPILTGVLLVAIWIFFDASADYTWSEAVIRKKSSEGWTVAVAQDNFVDLARPWTWVKTPVTGLWFTRPAEMREILDDAEPPRGPIIFAPVLRASYDYSKTEQDEDLEFFDLGAGRSAFSHMAGRPRTSSARPQTLSVKTLASIRTPGTLGPSWIGANTLREHRATN
jgi:hypothetical protein